MWIKGKVCARGSLRFPLKKCELKGTSLFAQTPLLPLSFLFSKIVFQILFSISFIFFICFITFQIVCYTVSIILTFTASYLHLEWMWILFFFLVFTYSLHNMCFNYCQVRYTICRLQNLYILSIFYNYSNWFFLRIWYS